ncbi:Ribosomal silencing factor RsfS [termite gut metagenome]|jgi:ribosome-associated protein|uniref:Ribosomal silencing factor RsfS n=1 Tax=termite gut metagenome TaxID=433724 RepID=A0A5J4S9L3_9ZZZZ|nr:ribosome silencing factor [Mediterranea sp.]
MNEAQILIKKVTEGIQEKKGKDITVVDLTNIENAICNYFIICQGNSPNQVGAIVDSIKESVRKAINIKPFGIAGLKNAEWVAMDYSDILVHVFQPQARTFYNLEQLWTGAKLINVPNIE